MGVDYAIKIGVGAVFSDAFLALVPRSVADAVVDATDDGHTVFVDVLYSEMYIQMHCGDVAPYPVLAPTTLSHDEIVDRALAALKLPDQELSVVRHVLGLDASYVQTGTFMLHYAW